MKYYFRCGHLGDNKKKCDICDCESILFKISTPRDRLQGRKAKYGNRLVDSRWDLPGFVYRPNEEYDVCFHGHTKRVLDRHGAYRVTGDRATAKTEEKKLKSYERILKLKESQASAQREDEIEKRIRKKKNPTKLIDETEKVIPLPDEKPKTRRSLLYTPMPERKSKESITPER